MQVEKLRIAIIQMDIAFGDARANREKADRMIRQAAATGTDLILLPELWTTAYDLTRILELADNEGQETKEQMSRLAKDLNVNILAGSVANKREGRVYNTTFLFNRRGEPMFTYSKLHLFRLMDEEKYLAAGSEIGQIEVEGLPCGTMICYDLRFPELSRKLALAGAKVLFIPAEWPHPRLHHWRTLQMARAIENQMFVVSCNRVGRAGDTEFFGHSMVVDPWGEILCEAGEEEQILHTEIDLKLADTVRQRIPIFEDRRSDLY
ncbi:carbon-nitrogen family hydrolase [Effusibacillus lacus]|uniref:Nitrilase n=1 Tax=Effusibacillus lacus TaxID=1348429 RepID=A0A292YEH9_9BACL|nr:carbon-nitrogen family hydrolase [Effusibacillus lacus]TCS74920.1 putative amidohydrolase [Effusibacillus lacus]GAX91592.1 nitrilase [Effusibacillus lacus]